MASLAHDTGNVPLFRLILGDPGIGQLDPMTDGVSEDVHQGAEEGAMAFGDQPNVVTDDLDRRQTLLQPVRQARGAAPVEAQGRLQVDHPSFGE